MEVFGRNLIFLLYSAVQKISKFQNPTILNEKNSIDKLLLVIFLILNLNKVLIDFFCDT